MTDHPAMNDAPRNLDHVRSAGRIYRTLGSYGMLHRIPEALRWNLLLWPWWADGWHPATLFALLAAMALLIPVDVGITRYYERRFGTLQVVAPRENAAELPSRWIVYPIAFGALAACMAISVGLAVVAERVGERLGVTLVFTIAAAFLLHFEWWTSGKRLRPHAYAFAACLVAVAVWDLPGLLKMKMLAVLWTVFYSLGGLLDHRRFVQLVAEQNEADGRAV